MGTRIKSLFTALLRAFAALATAALFSVPALADEPPKIEPTTEPTTTVSDAETAATAATAKEEPTAGAGLSSSWYFTDENGNRREPTAAEVRHMAEVFQENLARVAGKHKGKHNLQTYPDGTVRATVGLSKLEFLVVKQNDDGTLTYGHVTMDEDGNVAFQPTSPLPEM